MRSRLVMTPPALPKDAALKGKGWFNITMITIKKHRSRHGTPNENPYGQSLTFTRLRAVE